MPKRSQVRAMDTPINHVESDLQRRIRQRLEILQLSAVEAALRVGAPGELIRDILRLQDAAMPDPEVLHAIAEALETTPTWLRHGAEAEPDSTGPAIDGALHAKATIAAVQSLETAGLVLDPLALSELILHLYKCMDDSRQAV